jgi:release factor glutamine methyltransferase
VTALEKLREISQLFSEAGLEDPAKEATTIITEALQIGKTDFYTNTRTLDENISKRIDTFAIRRIQGEPLQYIIGHILFYGLTIHVGKGVLIPRPETELLVEETIRIMKQRKPPQTVLDLCTGTGCIALALAKEYPQAKIYGVDRSTSALSYAIRNARGNEIDNATFMEGDLFSIFGNDVKFDCIISNPPYVRRADIPRLQREIGYEPVEALDGGDDGLDYYRIIIKDAPRHLNSSGVMVLEIGFDQADDIQRIAEYNGYKNITFLKDYAGIRRIFVSYNV